MVAVDGRGPEIELQECVTIIELEEIDDDETT